VPILVADSHTRSTAQDLLSTPFALAKHADHRRRFYNIEDRIRLTDDTFACVDTRGSLQWAEAPEAAATDSPSIQLAAGNEMVAVLDSVDSLTCPGPEPEAFPARYTRSDGRIRVLNSEGEIAQYGTIATMRADGYRPIPLPLIPEHHVREQPSLARATLFASIANGTVVYDPIQ
jgi:hypothetical protein